MERERAKYACKDSLPSTLEESESTYSNRDYSEKATYAMIPTVCLSGKGKKTMEHWNNSRFLIIHI